MPTWSEHVPSQVTNCCFKSDWESNYSDEVIGHSFARGHGRRFQCLFRQIFRFSHLNKCASSNFRYWVDCFTTLQHSRSPSYCLLHTTSDFKLGRFKLTHMYTCGLFGDIHFLHNGLKLHSLQEILQWDLDDLGRLICLKLGGLIPDHWRTDTIKQNQFYMCTRLSDHNFVAMSTGPLKGSKSVKCLKSLSKVTFWCYNLTTEC